MNDLKRFLVFSFFFNLIIKKILNLFPAFKTNQRPIVKCRYQPNLSWNAKVIIIQCRTLVFDKAVASFFQFLFVFCFGFGWTTVDIIAQQRGHEEEGPSVKHLLTCVGLGRLLSLQLGEKGEKNKKNPPAYRFFLFLSEERLHLRPDRKQKMEENTPRWWWWRRRRRRGVTSRALHATRVSNRVNIYRTKGSKKTTHDPSPCVMLFHSSDGVQQ